MVRIPRIAGKFNHPRRGGTPAEVRILALPEFGGSAILSAMNQKVLVCAVLFAAGVCVSAPIPALGDDSAASIAAGGLVPRRETRIVMAKEVLGISPTKIVVDYDFRNDSDQDVTTEVAFPIPPYTDDFPNDDIPGQSFRSFRLWVNGNVVKYDAEARATLNGKEVTDVLRASHMDIPTFGHFVDTTDQNHSTVVVTPDFDRLPKDARERLLAAGLFEDQGFAYPTWTVHLQYHWTQAFPAHSTVHIRHEYTPTAGFQMVGLAAFKRALSVGKTPTPKLHPSGRPQDHYDQLMSFCPDPKFLRGSIDAIEKYAPDSDRYVYPQWVDFILTTANTWKHPIEDFTLIVERGRPLDGYGKPMESRRNLISFCSPQNAPVTKLDANHFQVHLTNFVPSSELRIGFFDLPEAKPAPASSGKPR
jgi:hypothetical protein